MPSHHDLGTPSAVVAVIITTITTTLLLLSSSSKEARPDEQEAGGCSSLLLADLSPSAGSRGRRSGRQNVLDDFTTLVVIQT